MNKLWEKTKKEVLIGYGTLKQTATGHARTDMEILNATDRLSFLLSTATHFKETVSAFFTNFQLLTGKPNLVSVAYQDQLKGDSDFSNASSKLHDSTTLISQKGLSVVHNSTLYVIQPVTEFINQCQAIQALQSKLNKKSILLDNAEDNLQKAKASDKQDKIDEATQELSKRQEKYDKCRLSYLDGVSLLDKTRPILFEKCLNGYQYVINDFIQTAKENLHPTSSLLSTELPYISIPDLHSVSV